MSNLSVYLIKTHPSLNEVKVGITNNILRRTRQHATTLPQLNLLKSWAAKPSDETAIIKLLRTHGRAISDEVFEIDPGVATKLIDNYFLTEREQRNDHHNYHPEQADLLLV